MKVYVAEVGAYTERYVAGVYTTAQAAMDAHPIPEKPLSGRAGRWKHDEAHGTWDNGLDWDEGVSIDEFELLGPAS